MAQGMRTGTVTVNIGDPFGVSHMECHIWRVTWHVTPGMSR